MSVQSIHWYCAHMMTVYFERNFLLYGLTMVWWTLTQEWSVCCLTLLGASGSWTLSNWPTGTYISPSGKWWPPPTHTHTHREGIAHIELCTLTPILERYEMSRKYKDHEQHLQRYKSIIKLLHQTQECMSIRFNHNFKHNCTHTLTNTCPLTSPPLSEPPDSAVSELTCCST